MSRRRTLSEDERVLWRTVTRSVAPLRGRKAEPEEATPVNAEPKRVAPLPAGVPGSRPSPRRAPAPPLLSPIDRRTVRKLARGTAEVDGRIDLHGLTQAEAHDALARFLRNAQARDAKVVLVITGKGAGPDADPHAERGVLKRQVPHWLESAEFRLFVAGFERASIGHGGAGALYVRVRKAR